MKQLVYNIVSSLGYEIYKRGNKPPITCKKTQRVLYLYRRFQQVQDLEGDIVECGVGHGESLLFLSYFVRMEGKQREIWGFDSFQGFPEPTEEDKSPRNPQKGAWGDTSKNVVLKMLKKGGYDCIRLIEGFFDDTMKGPLPEKIALLHLDVDLYQSYKLCLEALYPRIVQGGVILFDEYHDPNFPGADKAIDPFCKEHHLTILNDGDKYFTVKRSV